MIDLCCIQEDCSGSFEDKLIVKLVGYLKSRDVVRVTPDWNADEFGARHAQSVEQKETILQYDVPLTSLAGLVGQHSFPFAVRVPEALPPSVEVRTIEVEVARAVMTICSQKMHVFTRYCMNVSRRKLQTP